MAKNVWHTQNQSLIRAAWKHFNKRIRLILPCTVAMLTKQVVQSKIINITQKLKSYWLALCPDPFIIESLTCTFGQGDEGLWHPGQETNRRPFYFSVTQIFVKRLTPWKLARRKVRRRKRISHYTRFNAQIQFKLTNYGHVNGSMSLKGQWGYVKLSTFFHLARFCAPWKWRKGQVTLSPPAPAPTPQIRHCFRFST